eukprot:CAMPEP_0185723424 /NCGR_PEP_ID=MMETSP1171-20130828/273_1 /TAXON_ID=374046 /ORGANISM="Helicotheca tamensis, Strain CCMP826" /LENGTH=527 /DNA_ID=CAMNT_0028391123 /DNA_START=111 /DNA_END=1694 /DNA_ORIENTATION=+
MDISVDNDHNLLLPSIEMPAETNEVAHEALLGAEMPVEETKKIATMATLGSTPFSEDGEEVAHHAIVATEIVPDPVDPPIPDPVLQNAVVLFDPRLPDCRQLLESAKKRGLFVTAVLPKPPKKGLVKSKEFYPAAEDLLDIGVHQVYEPPAGQIFDICECANNLQTIESQQNLRFLGVIPLREAAVDYTDILGAMLGLTVHNDLGLCSCRRDKGLMKQAVANAGLRTAKYARLAAPDGSDVPYAIKNLDLEFPVVIKTPRGMSTMDVYICDTMDEAVKRSAQIVNSIAPDGKKASYSLMEEFLKGDEFAVNLIASPSLPRGVRVTDVWRYNKVVMHGTRVNKWQTMVDPEDKMYHLIVRYAEGVTRAVGIKHGLAHVELMTTFDEKTEKYVDPVMIEVGARLAGGRKGIMAQATIPGWYPFDAMIDAHCGIPLRVPLNFSPSLVARHVYVPNNGKAGKVTSIKGADFDRLKTHNCSIVLAKVGENVKVSRDIMSFPAFCWLVGTKEDVDADTKRAREEFIIEVEVEE